MLELGGIVLITTEFKFLCDVTVMELVKLDLKKLCYSSFC